VLASSSVSTPLGDQATAGAQGVVLDPGRHRLPQLVAVDPPDQADVELGERRPQLGDMAQAGIPGARVVDGNLHASEALDRGPELPVVVDRGADAGDELVEANRLGQEVVGARLETLDHTAVRTGTGHQQDGQRGRFGSRTERLDDAGPGHARQVHVEHEDVDRLRLQDLRRRLAGPGLEDVELAAPEG